MISVSLSNKIKNKTKQNKIGVTDCVPWQAGSEIKVLCIGYLLRDAVRIIICIGRKSNKAASILREESSDAAQ